MKRKHYIILGIVGLMLFTNPSRRSFISFLRGNNVNHIGRDFNGFIFSVYSNENIAHTGKFPKNGGYEFQKYYRSYYVGILSNFIKVSDGDSTLSNSIDK